MRSLLASSAIAAIAACAVLVACAPAKFVYAPVTTTSATLGPTTAKETIEGGDIRTSAPIVTTLEDGRSRALRLAVTVENDTTTPWAFDGGEQRADLTGAGMGYVFATTQQGTRATAIDVPPRESRTIELYFPLPPSFVGTSELPQLAVSWTVHTDGTALLGSTTFRRIAVTPAIVGPSLGDEERQGPLPSPLDSPVPHDPDAPRGVE